MKLIKTQDKFILISDEEIKEGDWIYDTFPNACPVKRQLTTIEEVEGIQKTEFKIISENPDFSLLNEEDCKKIGWVDFEKLAEEVTQKQMIRILGCEDRNEVLDDIQKRKFYFIEGFKTAQSLNDKMFSLEDMEKCFYQGCLYGETTPKTKREHFNDYIQSLQKTEWDVEVEKEDNLIIKGESDYFNYDNGEKLNIKYKKPKITNGKIKITEIL